MNDQSNVPALQRSLRELVDEYDEKRAAITGAVSAFNSQIGVLESACTIGGEYVGSIWGRGSPSIHETTLERNLLKSAWMHVYKGLNLHRIASASDRKRFERSFEDPPEFTLGNLRATFGEYVADPRHHILKGLAECFVDLDQAFKSHSKIKVGVAGLPKRIILPSCSGYGGYGQDKLRDTLNAVRVFEGKPHMEYREFSDILEQAAKDRVEFEGFKLEIYGNGNGHLHFSPDKLRAINLALAEFYGEVLPDVEDDEPAQDLFRSREVSKDLQYYPTPPAVINAALNSLHLPGDAKVLEPSCGDGRIMDAVREWKPEACIHGIEIHPGRAEEARQKGHKVYVANFLELPPEPIYDLVVMNPPFYGKHWQKHVMHGLKFLKPHTERWGPSPTLITILPATAFYDGHLGAMGLVPPDAHTKDRGWRDSGWKDLPVASFAESGTNVPTGYLLTGGSRWK